MPTKDYVCRLCLGTGEVDVHCEDERCNHQNEGCTEGWAGPCPLCVAQGRPPVITGQTSDDLTIEVLPGGRLNP